MNLGVSFASNPPRAASPSQLSGPLFYLTRSSPTFEQMELQQIRQTFDREFGPVADKFEFIVLSGDEAASATDPVVARPGVYVHWKDDQAIRIGRSFSNARKRALEHIRDNTGETMAELKDDPEARLVLFTVAPEDYHWAAALEIYLEDNLDPSIPCGRRG